MTDLFITLINMSINAGWFVLAVILVRFIFKRAPKYIIVCLWALVAVRLVLPVSFETALSLIPSAQTVPDNIAYSDAPMIHSGIGMLNSTVNPIINNYFAPTVGDSVNPLQIVTEIGSYLWISGAVAMLAYAVISYLKVAKRVREAVILRDNIYLSDRIAEPFIFGLLKPKIYIPTGIREEDSKYVINHEKAHIKRKDYLWKPIGFLLLAVYWFNPLMWVAYILLCKDIESACDQKVLNGEGEEGKKAYSLALVNCSAPKKFITACPLAFGETGIKSRIKSVLNYKKPAFWVSITAILLSAVLAVCFLTNPVTKRIVDINDPAFTLTLLDNVYEYEFTAINYGQNYHGEVEIEDITKTLLKVQISDSPISNDRSDYRPKTYSIIVRGSGFEIIWFNEDFTEVWVYDGVKPTLSYEIYNPQIVAELFEKYTEDISDYSPQEEPEPTKGKKLTLNDVIRLADKGETLGWADFEDFSYIETGSGLYIRQYEIDEMFYLSIGGGSTDDLMYIYLSANDGQNKTIDVRTGGVKEFIKKHKDNPVVTNLSASWDIYSVEYERELYGKIVSEWGIPKYALVSSVKTYPVKRISTKEEWLEAYSELEEIANSQYTGGTRSPLISGKYTYTEQFFKHNDIVLVYVECDGSKDYNTFNVSKSQNTLTMLFNESKSETENPQKEGKIFAIRLYKKDILDVESITAYEKINENQVENWVEKVAFKVYTFNDCDGVLPPTIALFADDSFQLNFGGFSSYFGVGTYKIVDGVMVLKTDDYQYKYEFKMADDKLIFDAENSSKELHNSGLYDGAVFE